MKLTNRNHFAICQSYIKVFYPRFTVLCMVYTWHVRSLNNFKFIINFCILKLVTKLVADRKIYIFLVTNTAVKDAEKENLTRRATDKENLKQ